MFLVECNELNQQLIFICDRLIEKILKKIFDYIVEQTQQSISAEVRTITTRFAEKADSTTSLVEYEAYLESVRMQKRKEIFENYNDLIEWLMLLYEYPQYEPADDI